jgi:hypothetical protein
LLGLVFRFGLFASRTAAGHAQIHHRASRTALLTGFKATILTGLGVCFMRECHQTNRRAHDQRCKMKFRHPILPLPYTLVGRAAQLFNLSPFVERVIPGKSPWRPWRLPWGGLDQLPQLLATTDEVIY